MIFCDVNFVGYFVCNDLLVVCKVMVNFDIDVCDGCVVFVEWNFIDNVDVCVVYLFCEFWMCVKDILYVYVVDFNFVDLIYILCNLCMSDVIVCMVVFKVLKDVVSVVCIVGFVLDVFLGIVQVVYVLGGDIVLYGGEEYEGVFNKL